MLERRRQAGRREWGCGDTAELWRELKTVPYTRLQRRRKERKCW